MIHRSPAKGKKERGRERVIENVCLIHQTSGSNTALQSSILRSELFIEQFSFIELRFVDWFVGSLILQCHAVENFKVGGVVRLDKSALN